MTPSIINVAVKKGSDGSKHLDVKIHGVIGGGWFDEASITSTQLAEELTAHADAKTVLCDINSVGGSLFDGIAMLNALDAHPGEVTCRITGLAASAASLPALAGRTEMGLGAMMMIHKPSAMAAGTADDMRKAATMLDQAQAALASIYQKKTGKPLAEINDLINEETWFTADEAVAAGFADAVAHAEPDGDEGEDGKEPPGPKEPTAIGGLVVWNGVAFPRTALPAQIVALAKPAKPAAAALSLAAAPPAAAPVAPLVNRAYLDAHHPELVAALIEEGRAAGVVAERTRLQAIDDLPALGCVELVVAAKYGAAPLDASALAVQIVKAQKGAGAELLAARQIESASMSNLGAPAPDASTVAANEQRIVAAIAAGGNARRGVRQ